ncbi:hypothetical protein [Mucilaginibacter pallidiroseus]|uniref:hypothetical protein n=1 Tax=Mucilaginibacter pallidiroseus TaxID=2599295 RepID=UPI001646CCA8|nr:hypothetical protein [Mucilaginibacter pallidiroseus]
MESENPFFCFPLVYGDEAVVCKAVMQDIGYDIEFDGRWMASIAHTEDWTWIQSAGVILPAAIIEEIGLRIESEYK